jgi:hypothetical protein
VICDREPCHVIKAQGHKSFAKLQSDSASLSAFVELGDGSRKLVLTLATVPGLPAENWVPFARPALTKAPPGGISLIGV